MPRNQIKARVKGKQSRWRIRPAIHSHNRKRNRQKGKCKLPYPPKQVYPNRRLLQKEKALRVRACRRMPQQHQVKRAIKDHRITLVRPRELLLMEARKPRLKLAGPKNRMIQNKVRKQINKMQIKQRRTQRNKANLYHQPKKREENPKGHRSLECQQGW